MTQQGWYLDPPSRRIPYDIDGTILTLNGSTLSSGTAIALNQLNGTTIGGGSDYTVIFWYPVLMNLTHLFFNSNQNNGLFAHYIDTMWSPDTTNGSDGNWTNINGGQVASTDVVSYFRNPTPVSAEGVKAIRYRWTGGSFNFVIGTIHQYGYPQAGQNQHRLEVTDSGGSPFNIDHDFGDQPRNSARIWSPTETWNEGSAMYIRNRSPEKSAINVRASIDGAGTNMNSNTLLSLDGNSWALYYEWPEITPGQIIGPIYMKHSPPIGETLGLDICRTKVSVEDWI